jgi:hypothetical protein
MSRNDKLNQFDDLIDELQRSDKRPSTPRAFKQELRSQLLNQYNNPGFSLATLGRLAGTAVALGILGFIVVYAWGVMSRPGAAGGPVDVTRPVQSTPEPTARPVETAVPTPEHAPNDVWLISATQHARSSVDAMVTLDITVGYQFEADEEVILKPLYANPNWESASGGRSPIDGLSEAITLTEKTGTQTITFSASPAEMRQIVGTDQPVLVMQLGYLSEAENGRRELNILAMPTLTGFVIDLARTHEMQYYEPDYTAVVSGTGGNGLTLQSEPNGQQLGVLEEGNVVTLNDDPLLESEGLLWQSVSTTIGKGWVVADFLDYPAGYTPNQLWMTKAIQLPRSSSDEAITLEVTMEYMLVTAEEAVLSLSFIHPAWEETSLEGYRYPNFNALGDKYPVQTGTGSVTITATIEPEAITSALNSNEFELMTRLWATDEDGQPTTDLILMGFENSMTFDTESVEEITYP